ncbi:hypothetical protein ASZ78_004739 [Callipepla squamata]|uniref:SAM domain-containing protein n=1 Tax=Callipepla squamata TaxID=9009 RepID=A0A226N103_CALSU|nr:hypothetical protein ASZ78_004739 [Callipepla squamata]
MDLRNIPYRSEVVTWNPDDLAEYFKTLKYKDCEKVVRKYSINGQRFLNMSENDIQKFPKLRVPGQTQKSAESSGYSQEDDGWSSFDEDDDYESPDDDQEKEDEADYESPTEETEEAEHDSDGYEPPPSNNDEAHHNVIFPAKSLANSTDYIGRKLHHPEKLLTPQLRALGEQLSMMPKPPVPPSDRYERGNPTPPRKQIPVKQGWVQQKRPEVSIASKQTYTPQRVVPQISLPPYSSNTFPSKSIKPPPKPGSNSMPGAESSRSLSASGSLPPRFPLGRNFFSKRQLKKNYHSSVCIDGVVQG